MKQLTLLSVLVLIFGLLSPGLQAQSADQQTRSLIDDLDLEEADTAMRDVPGWHIPDRIHVDFTSYGEDHEMQMMLDSLKEVAGGVEIVPVGRQLDQDTLRNLQVLIGRCRPQQIRHANKLIWLQHSAHGADDCLTDETRQMKFIMTNAQHTSAPPMSEHAIALMMNMTRGLYEFRLAQSRREWIRNSIDFPVIEIGGKTILIVGLGGIGTAVAEKAHALGMRVLATRNTSREGPDFVEYVGLSHEIYDLAKQADVVVNTLPLTDDTRNLFDKRFFDTVKHGAFYISIGRGETTVQADLAAALKDGRLTAAAIDVTDPEPLPEGNELWGLPNAIITPHVAYNTDQGRWRRWLVVRENLKRFINGDKLLNVVDKQLGY